jgi:UDP-glucose 4-epimerase
MANWELTFAECWGEKVSVLPLKRWETDVSDSAQVDRVLGALQADVVISTAAFHKVEECEKQPAQSFAVNAVGPRNLALACRQNNLCSFTSARTTFLMAASAVATQSPISPGNSYPSHYARDVSWATILKRISSLCVGNTTDGSILNCDLSRHT